MADQENREYTLLEIWRGNAYSAQKTQKEANEFWAKYFTIEKGIYEKILAELKADGQVSLDTKFYLMQKVFMLSLIHI